MAFFFPADARRFRARIIAEEKRDGRDMQQQYFSFFSFLFSLPTLVFSLYTE